MILDVFFVPIIIPFSILVNTLARTIIVVNTKKPQASCLGLLNISLSSLAIRLFCCFFFSFSTCEFVVLCLRTNNHILESSHT